MNDKFGAGRGSDTEGAGARTSRPTSSAATAPPLDEAFAAWVEQHGYVWFAADLALAASIARHLGIDLEIDGVAVADEVPGVTQG